MRALKNILTAFLLNEQTFRSGNRIHSLRRDRKSDTRYNVKEPWLHYAKGNKPVAKDKYRMIPLTWGTQKGKSTETEGRCPLRQGQQAGAWGVSVWWARSSSLRKGKSSGDVWCDGYTTVWMHLMPQNCTPKHGHNFRLCLFYHN